MKKIQIIFIYSCFLLVIVSCGNKADKSDKASNLAELKSKYQHKKFENCDQAFNTLQEMTEVYFSSIDKALKGDCQAKKDVESFNEFMDEFNDQISKFSTDCPEKYKIYKENLDKKTIEYIPKTLQLFPIDEKDVEKWKKEGDYIENLDKSNSV